jgi:hypothetical protein
MTRFGILFGLFFGFVAGSLLNGRHCSANVSQQSPMARIPQGAGSLSPIT